MPIHSKLLLPLLLVVPGLAPAASFTVLNSSFSVASGAGIPAAPSSFLLNSAPLGTGFDHTFGTTGDYLLVGATSPNASISFDGFNAGISLLDSNQKLAALSGDNLRIRFDWAFDGSDNNFESNVTIRMVGLGGANAFTIFNAASALDYGLHRSFDASFAIATTDLYAMQVLLNEGGTTRNSVFAMDNITLEVVPEPQTGLAGVLASGLLGLLAHRRRRRGAVARATQSASVAASARALAR